MSGKVSPVIITVTSPSKSAEDDSTAQAQLETLTPKLFKIILLFYAFGENARLFPWFLFAAAFACRLDQLIGEMCNRDNTTIFKMVILCSFALESAGFMLTVHRRKSTRQLTDAIFSKVQRENHSLISRLEVIAVILLLSLCLGTSVILSVFNSLTSGRIKYTLVIRLPNCPALFWLSVFIFRMLVKLIVLALYVNCSLHVLAFVALSLNRLHIIREMKKLVPRDSERIMKELIKMDEELTHFEGHSSIAIFMMISAHFLEISLFLYRLVTYESVAPVHHVVTIFWTVTNTLLVLYSITIISIFQEKVKTAGLELANCFFAHASPSQYNIASVMADKVKCVTGRCITAWNIVDIDRKLIIAIYSSFLTIAVLLVQMDNGALKADAARAHPTSPGPN